MFKKLLRCVSLRADSKTDIRSLNPLNFIGKAVAILPNVHLYCVDDYKSRCSYPIAVMVVFLLAFSYTTFGKFLTTSSFFQPTVHVLDTAADTILTISNVGSIVGINLICGKNVVAFITNLRRIDNEFAKIKGISCASFRFNAELLVTHAFFFVYFFYNMYIWTGSLGWDTYKYFILRDLQNYHIYILSLILRSYALAIRFRCELLNKMLKTCVGKSEDGVISLMVDEGKETPEWDLKKSRKIFTDLTVILEQYNQIFGWHFVPLYVNILVNLLMPVNIAVVYGSGEKDINGVRFGFALVVLCIIWGSCPLSMAAAVFSACDQATSEMTKTRDICYILIQDLSNNDKELVLKEQLQELAQQATNKRPAITGAGFFTVNYSLLFSLIGSISSYLIVLLQFNKKD